MKYDWPGLERWRKLWKSIGAAGDPEPWHDRLRAAYAEPWRHYHNQQHLGECLAAFDQIRPLAAHPETVETALWFHDAVYNPRASDNEELSADLAVRCLQEAGISAQFQKNVANLVMATKHHPSDTDVDASILTDADLCILGQEEVRFTEYESQIRKEYGWVPDAEFNSKRAKLLKGFLARKRIYATDSFREKHELRARENLSRSVQRLEEGP